jgi:hypothetical protein
MKTELPGVEWLLDCEPRVVQLEATARSYTGAIWRMHKDDELAPFPIRLPHYGGPADGWGHCMEMRLGKTPTALNEFLLFNRDHGIKRMLMWCPNKYKHTWALEATKFGVVLPVHVFDSSNRKEALKFVQNPEGLMFINYEAAVYDTNMAIIRDWVSDSCYMGADESVLTKNREATVTKRVFELSKDVQVSRILTGKPTPQGPADWYSQLRIAKKLNGWNYYQFRGKFCEMGGFKGKKIMGVKNEDKLQEVLRESVFFARRKDWGNWLQTDYEIVDVAMTPEQQKAYDEMEKDFITWLDSGVMVTADQVITKYIKLQQISSGFVYDENSAAHPIMSFDKVPKFVELKDRIDNYVQGKIIIVAFYKNTINSLISALKEHNPAVIGGEDLMKKLGRKIDEEKNRFNGDGTDVMIAQIKAVKYGHTLMGNEDNPCSTMAYFENTFSLDDRAQSEERPQGEGQKVPLYCMDFCSSPRDRGILEALHRKEDMAAKIMGYYKK